MLKATHKTWMPKIIILPDSYLDALCFTVFILGQAILSYKVKHAGTTLVIIVDYCCRRKMLLTSEVAPWEKLTWIRAASRTRRLLSPFKVENRV